MTIKITGRAVLIFFAVVFTFFALALILSSVGGGSGPKQVKVTPVQRP
jgi:hypothetical protein